MYENKDTEVVVYVKYEAFCKCTMSMSVDIKSRNNFSVPLIASLFNACKRTVNTPAKFILFIIVDSIILLIEVLESPTRQDQIGRVKCKESHTLIK
jgi:hypothetical protein